MSWADLKYQQALSPSEHKATCTKHCFPQSSSCSAFKFLKLLKFYRAALQFVFFSFLKFIHNQELGGASLLNIAMACSYAGIDWAGMSVQGMRKSWLQLLAWWWNGGSWRKALAARVWGPESEHQQPLQSMPSMFICPYNASARTQRHKDPSRPSLIWVSGTQWETLKKAKDRWLLRNDPWGWPLDSTCTHTYVHTNIHVYPCVSMHMHAHTHKHTQVRMVQKVRSTWNITMRREASKFCWAKALLLGSPLADLSCFQMTFKSLKAGGWGSTRVTLSVPL